MHCTYPGVISYHDMSPVGLPAQLNLADGSAVVAPTPDAAQLMQEIACEVLHSLQETGVGS